MKEKFEFNKKKARRDLIGNVFVTVFFGGGTYILLFLGNDGESRFLGYFFLLCVVWFAYLLFRGMYWLLTAKDRYIIVDDEKITRSWNGKVESWLIKDYRCEMSLIKTRDAGNLISVYLVDKDRNRVLLTENDWIGEFSVLVKSAIEQRQGLYGEEGK